MLAKIAALVTALISFFSGQGSPASISEHSTRIFDPQFWQQAEVQSVKYRTDVQGKITGGIVPHHLLAAGVAGGWFAGLPQNQRTAVKRVILLSPNHHNLGPEDIITSSSAWKTHLGTVYPDERELNVREWEPVFEREHGIYAIVPWIKRYLPKAKLTPIVLKSSITRHSADQLVEKLKKILGPGTLIVASLDFSHYLSIDDAFASDEETILAIQSTDPDRIWELHPTRNVDSPAVLYVLTQIMKHTQNPDSLLAVHTNSAQWGSKDGIQSTTSHMAWYFGRELSTNPVTLAVTGDVLLARSVNARMTDLNDFTYPWLKVANKLSQADITFINLETPLLLDCRPTTEGMKFCGDTRAVQGLKTAGVDVVNLANNHTCNYGRSGLNQTLKILRENGIFWTGTHADPPPVISVRGQKIAFLGFNDTGAGVCGVNSASQISKSIRDQKSKANWVIVQFHWGTEYTAQPNSRQKSLARLAINSGADLVVGNHPHWVQPRETYQGKIISYSHGNFIFDQTWSRETMRGAVGWYQLGHGGTAQVEFLPVDTGADFQASWIDPQ